MRLNALAACAQLFVICMFIGLALICIYTLEETDVAVTELAATTTAGTDAPVSASELVTRVKKSISGSIGLIAVVAGGGMFTFLLLGAWVARNVSAPLANLQSATRSVADGHVQRRIDAMGGIAELESLGTDVNRIVDRLRTLRTAHGADEPLIQAALETLFDAAGRPAGVLDTAGRLVSSNKAASRLPDRGPARARPPARARQGPRNPCRHMSTRSAVAASSAAIWFASIRRSDDAEGAWVSKRLLTPSGKCLGA